MSNINKITSSSITLFAAIAAATVVSGAARAEESIKVAPTSQTIEQVEANTKVTTVAQATEQIQSNDESALVRQVGQDPLMRKSNSTTAQNVTSVSQLSDVKPTDWAFTALQSLVERYGCIAGYPDRTYRGQRPLSRYEFAAGLNACLDKINELISAGLADKVSKADLAAVQKLQEEFAAELAALRGRVDALEAKTAQLEAQQFSTTTKLNAIAIFAAAGATGGDGLAVRPGGPLDTRDTNVTFSGRVRLNFDTSFTGKDRLRTRLQAGNVTRFDQGTGTRMARLGFDTSEEANAFVLDKLYYRFPLSDAITAYVGTKFNIDDVFDNFNPYLNSSDYGALSRFGRFDPFTLRGPGEAGAALSFKPSSQFTINALYMADSGASTPTGQNGLTNGGYSAGIQLVYAPSKDLKFGAAYIRSYEPGSRVNLASSTGSALGSAPFGAVDTSADRYGFQASWLATKGFNISGWVGFANAHQESAFANGTGIGNDANLFNWSAQLAFPDLFAEGNLGAIIVGQQPKITSNSITAREDIDSSFHLEALYRFRVSKNISITPGVFWVFNPDHDEDKSSVFVGAIRTTFSF